MDNCFFCSSNYNVVKNVCGHCHYYWSDIDESLKQEYYKVREDMDKHYKLLGGFEDATGVSMIAEEKVIITDKALRYNDGKPPLDLVPETVVFAIAKVLDAGQKKYTKHNWRKGLSISSQLASLNRHLKKFESPHLGDFDEETKLHEMMMVACNVAMIIDTLVSKPELDDRFSYLKKSTLSTEEWLKMLGMK